MEIVMDYLEHFSHPHALILKEELAYNGEEVVCSGCDEPILDLCYSCLSCYFFLHKKCSELPQKINRHFHPEHPLLLLAKPPPHYKGSYLCDGCDKTFESFVYHCSLCNFDLDTKCAFPPCLFEANNSQEHQFRRLMSSIPLKSLSFTCNACGTAGEDSPYMCTLCLLVVHKECISLPRTMKKHCLGHSRMEHTYSLGQEGSGSVELYCGRCFEEVKAGFGGYYCPSCEFVAHVSCTLGNMLEETAEEELCTTVSDELMESPAYSVKEIKQGNNIVITEMKHFSHQHSLILMDEINRDLKCDGCMLPVSSSYYGCAQCNFYLDKYCTELPRHVKLLYHANVMPLILKAGTYDGIFVCGICQEYSHGFSYRYDHEYEISVDVRCLGLTREFIEHKGHEHPLFVTLEPGDRCCNACGVTRTSFSFTCAVCRFNLDFKCASLPHKVWHKYDNHPLFLTFVDPNTYQFYCQICEKERDRKLWFYRCDDCDFDAHIDCVIGKNPYVKFGGTYMYSIHSHPLALVEKMEDHLACHTCGEPCDDLALECTDCNFIIHRKKPNCMRLNDSDGIVEFLND